jgi:hypothetical protein
MKAIQVLLIGAMVVAGLMFLFRIKSNVFFKPILGLLLLAGIFFVLFPDTTTVIANMMGVDRGADMIFYIYIVSSLIVLIHFYSRLRSLQADLTSLLREQALRNAVKLGGPDRKAFVSEEKESDL